MVFRNGAYIIFLIISLLIIYNASQKKSLQLEKKSTLICEKVQNPDVTRMGICFG